ncbi:MAG: CrcB family protein [Streptococcaceae bacterium]|jgi:CrcB protein|nr:CrcB family protein [Streptococcaceae bacterium]
MSILVVFIFGILGGISRIGVNQLLANYHGFPIATLAINLIGCFLFSFFVKNFLVKKQLGEIWILAAGTGFLGAFTTFSSTILDSYRLIASGSYVSALIYALMTMFGGLAMIIIGVIAAQKVMK